MTPENPRPDAPVPPAAPARGGATDSTIDLADGAAGTPDLADRPAEAPGTTAVVTAILVAHDGVRWLPSTLTSLDRLTRRPDRFIAVDTGSTDDTAALLEEWIGGPSIVRLPRDTGFAAAVGTAIERAGVTPVRPGVGPVTEWYWLLHDDSAPDPDTLDALLRTAADRPEAGIVGPKSLAWYDRRLLQEVGVTLAGSGRRETGLERREQDQGQHDGIHRVLAVGTAGLLVRRDVWEELGGLDRALPLFRDDVDLGWRAWSAGHEVLCTTDAVVHHAEAAAHGRRPLAAGAVHRRHQLDRRSALYVLLANVPAWLLPFALGRLVVGSLLRSAGYLLGKLPGEAFDELAALGSVLARPDRLLAARRARRPLRRVPYSVIRPLLAPRSAQVRHTVEAITGLLSGHVPAVPGMTEPGRHRVAVETGPGSDDAEDLAVGGGLGAALRATLRRPPVLLVAGLVVLTLVAVRDLWGGGTLTGGALLPGTQDAGDLWNAYRASWHGVGLGSDALAPPYLAVLAGLAAVLPGSADTAVSVLLLGCVPLAGLSCYAALRRLVPSPVVRCWAALTWASLPSATGAVAAGRVGTATLMILLPPLGLAFARSRDSWRAAAMTAALLGLAATFAPSLLLVAVPVAVGAAVLRTGWSVAGRIRPLVALAAGVALLGPYGLHLLADPERLMVEPGLPGPHLTDPDLAPAAVALVHPGGPGTYPLVLTAGLVLGALAALLRRERRRPILGAWGVALVAATAGVVVSRTDVPALLSPGTQRAWPGAVLAAAGFALVVAAAVGATGLRHRIRRASFGWRQPAALLVLVAAAATPMLALGSWGVRGAGDPLTRAHTGVLPAFVAAQDAQPTRPRTLVLEGSGSTLSYALLREPALRLGDAEVLRLGAGTARLARLVGDLAAGAGTTSADRLAAYGIGTVLVRGEEARASGVPRALDATPGLARATVQGGAALWTVTGPAGRLRIVEPSGTARVLPSGQVGADTRIESGATGRRLVLAERADDGWRATLDGRALRRVTIDGWAQGFALPASGGRLVLTHDDGGRGAWIAGQGIGLVLLLLLALPGVRRSSPDDGEDVAVVPAAATTPVPATNPTPMPAPRTEPDAATDGSPA